MNNREQKTYYQKHRETIKEYQKEYYKRNQKRIRERQNKNRKNIYKKRANKEREYSKRYYNEHKDEILNRQKEYSKNSQYRKIKMREYKRNEYKKHPLKFKIKDTKRRKNIETIIHNLTEDEWNQKINSMDGICPVCNRPFEEGFGLTMDHNPPVSQVPIGFVYTIDNVNPLCLSCNASKGKRYNDNTKLENFIKN